MKAVILTASILIVPCLVFSQNLNDSTKYSQLLDSISMLNKRFSKELDRNKKERIQLGLSFAYGEISKSDRARYVQPTISPIDSTLSLQQLDDNFVLISTTMTITPLLYASMFERERSKVSDDTDGKPFWKGSKRVGLWLLENSGFSVNINFLQIATGSSQQSFNQNVEGGIGYSIRISKNIYYSLSRELKFINSLNDNFKEGEPIYYQGNKIGSIDELSVSDRNYYHQSTLLHWSMRLIICF